MKALQRTRLCAGPGWLMIFAGTLHVLFKSIFDLFASHCVKPDLPSEVLEAGCYVSELVWRPTGAQSGIGGKVPVDLQAGPAVRKPTEQELNKFIRQSKLDLTVPISPSMRRRGFRFHLKGGIGDPEWAQMWYGERLTDEVQLRESTHVSYQLPQLKVCEFKSRYLGTSTDSQEGSTTDGSMRDTSANESGPIVMRVLS